MHSFSIKNIFYDEMDLRLFYFHVTIYWMASERRQLTSFQCLQELFYQSTCRFTVCYTYIFYYSQVKTYGFQFSWNQRYWVISSAIESFKGSVDNHRHVVCLWPREQVSPHFLWKRKLFDTVSFSGNPFYFMHNLLYCKAIRLLETAVCT